MDACCPPLRRDIRPSSRCQRIDASPIVSFAALLMSSSPRVEDGRSTASSYSIFSLVVGHRASLTSLSLLCVCLRVAAGEDWLAHSSNTFTGPEDVSGRSKNTTSVPSRSCCSLALSDLQTTNLDVTENLKSSEKTGVRRKRPFNSKYETSFNSHGKRQVSQFPSVLRIHDMSTDHPRQRVLTSVTQMQEESTNCQP